MLNQRKLDLIFISNLKVLSDLDGGQRALEALHNFWWQGRLKI